MGKIEMESVEDGRESKIIDGLTKNAVLNVFGRYFNVREFEPVIQKFEAGLTVETGSDMPSKDYLAKMKEMDGLSGPLGRLGASGSPEEAAAGVEFILEGLHLNRRLNRNKVEGRYIYRS
ncbi:MAG: magnesium chelatase, partial [Chloroflexota bacterium]